MISLRSGGMRRALVAAPAFLLLMGISPPQACAQDFWVNAPGTWTGNTCGQGDDCWLESSEDHEYAVDIPWPGYWHFELCDSMFDTVLGVGPVVCNCDYG